MIERQDSEEGARDLIEASVQGVLIHRTDGKPLFANQALADLLGYQSIQDILGMASIDTAPAQEQSASTLIRLDALMSRNNGSASYDFAAIGKDGATRQLRAVAHAVTWQGEPAMQTTIIDVSDSESANAALIEAQDKLRAIGSISQNAFFLINPQGEVNFWNHGAAAMFGYTEKEAIGVELAKLIVLEPDRERHRTRVERLAQTGNGGINRPDSVSMKAVRRSGETFPAELTISPVRIGGQSWTVGIVSDLTERELVEAQLNRDIDFQKAIADILKVSLEPIGLREKLTKILEQVVSVPGLEIQGKGSIFLNNFNGQLEMWAQKNLAEPLLEMCASIPVGHCLCGQAAESRKVVFSKFVDDRHVVRFAGMQPHGHYCVPIRSGTGQVLGVLNTYVQERHEEDPREVAFLSTIADTLAGVIEHHRMAERYQGLSQAVEQSPASVVITDPAGNIQYVNSKFVQVTGYSLQEVLGKNPRILKSGETAAEDYAAMWRTIWAGGEWRCEFQNRKKNGDLFVESAIISPIRDGEGVITNFVAVKEDITELKRMEAQLSHAQKMESIGQLAAGIAHEINTPTQYIGDNLRFVHEAFADTTRMLNAYETLLQSASGANTADSERSAALAELKERLDIDYLIQEVPQAIAQTLEGVSRVVSIVGAMKQFAHPGSAQKTPENLNAAIESTVIVARNEWKYVASLDLDLDPQLPFVPCLINDINQVVLNMIVNASHAIQEKRGKAPETKGKISITTRTEKDMAVIRIRDDGAGIPKHIQTKIFDLFFTTKEVGKGTGQGLAISHTVVHEKHGGYISCESEPGEGTMFGIHLPLNVTVVGDE